MKSEFRFEYLGFDVFIKMCHSEKTENQALSINFRLIQNLF